MSGAQGGRPARRNDPDLTREDILAVAAEEFSDLGLAGARVDAIAERTKTSKRMIYYYFGSKEGLYLAVLERAYKSIRSVEGDLSLGQLAPETALATLIESTFDYDDGHPDFIRLVAIENIHKAEHMARSSSIAGLNVSVIETLGAILAEGYRRGAFRRRAEPVDVHMLISSFCFFRVSNRYTFGTIFGLDLADPAVRERHRRMIVDAVLAYLKAEA
ncbi:TetR/AcrR family transcriptional regulator [Segnochrobactrum spirostomi]|uniref:TetR/AcrR family transcriptional regulator n=1 Tax=Segnochrobactrum spirostomi TaxID=2608987 RepID=A0A6A7Y9P9_9HYPH|nr:TetR/AcrR family transcriptional regulator [Segnochrobactrum spirostomi]MQT14728.1 TetR/AcrR family transcriptional regulator [Segnochrobactrum spirostomi]